MPRGKEIMFIVYIYIYIYIVCNSLRVFFVGGENNPIEYK